MERMQVVDGLSVFKFKEELCNRGLSLVFHGMFSNDVLSLIGLSLKRIPNSEVTAKRLFALVVEMTQNILHYSAERMYSERDQREVGVGVVGIGGDEEYHIVVSGNKIKNHEADYILNSGKIVNEVAHDKDKIQELYKQRRKEPQRADKPGANLGFIVMAKLSRSPLNIEIIPINDQESFFVLSVKVKKDQQ